MFTGADKRVLNAKESEAYMALAFQGSSWTDEHAFPLMIMQTIMGGWDRSSGEGATGRSYVRLIDFCPSSVLYLPAVSPWRRSERVVERPFWCARVTYRPSVLPSADRTISPDALSVKA